MNKLLAHRKNFVVAGGTRGIGLAMIKNLLNESSQVNVMACYRKQSELDQIMSLKKQYPEQLSMVEVNIDNESSFKQLAQQASDQFGHLDGVINCIGILHDEAQGIFPERKLQEISVQNHLEVYKTNVLPTLLLAKYLSPMMKEANSPLFASVSAKVGSIEDNKMGGWHSYRISKAALNMAIKNISIEIKRINKNSLCVALHPGTTATQLSEPFMVSAQKKYKIHTAEETAQNLLQVLNEQTSEEHNGGFFSWDGTSLPW